MSNAFASLAFCIEWNRTLLVYVKNELKRFYRMQQRISVQQNRLNAFICTEGLFVVVVVCVAVCSLSLPESRQVQHCISIPCHTTMHIDTFFCKWARLTLKQCSCTRLTMAMLISSSRLCFFFGILSNDLISLFPLCVRVFFSLLYEFLLVARPIVFLTRVSMAFHFKFFRALRVKCNFIVGADIAEEICRLT